MLKRRHHCEQSERQQFSNMRSRRAMTRVKLFAAITLMLGIAAVTCCCWLTRLPFATRVALASSLPPGRNSSKLLCFVLAHPNRAAASVAVRDTWGARCDTLLFFSANPVPEVDSVVVPGSVDGYYRLWGHVRRIWAHIGVSMRQLAERHDWFLKADDDTYVIVQNLRRFLDERHLPTTDDDRHDRAVWYGAKLKNPKLSGGYNSGGAGYVLNRRALQLFANGSACSQIDYGYEDLELGRCLERLGVATGDTRDDAGRPTFMPFPAEDLLSPIANAAPTALMTDVLANNASWYWKSIWWPHPLVRETLAYKQPSVLTHDNR